MALLTTQEVETSTQNCLVEHQGAGTPLVISFGFYDNANNPQFNFYGRLKKVEQATGRPLSKLLLRDPLQVWYLRGVQGMGDNVAQTITALRRMIDTLAPSSITTVGQSMGGFAAILYGILLRADKVLSFGPLSCFDATIWELLGDRRWQPQLDLLKGIDIHPHHDLVSLMHAQTHPLPAIDILYGTSPGEGIPRLDATGYDSAHAMRFEGLPCVTRLPVHPSTHPVVQYFHQHGVITDLFCNRLFAQPLEGAIARLLQTHPWMPWLEENVARRCHEAELRAAMRANAINNDQQNAMFGRVHAIHALRRIASQPPAFTL